MLGWNARSVLIVMGAWTGLAAVSMLGGVFALRQNDVPIHSDFMAGRVAASWYSCAVFTPLYIWAARRSPITRTTWPRAVSIWLVLTVLSVPARFVVEYWMRLAVVPSAINGPLLERIFNGFASELIAFWCMAGIIMSIEYHDRWRERDRHADRLSKELVDARLEALSAQLQPHFLFNTLQGISTLLYRDVDAADRMLRRLSELLRGSLRAATKPDVPLVEELALLNNYIEIQRQRFEDRLRVNIDIDGAGEALVPYLVLQPLVENAIHHGVARHAGTATVEIIARMRGGTLEIEVRDDCRPAFGQPAAPTNGIGLANTRARLATMYGAAGDVRTRDLDGGGFSVTLVMPLRMAAAAA